MRKLKYTLIIILIFGCQSGSENNNHWGVESPDLISAVDISIQLFQKMEYYFIMTKEIKLTFLIHFLKRV